MDFSFTPDQESLRSHLKELLDAVCPPEYAAKCDEDARPPREAYDAVAKHGWFGLSLPVEYGGMAEPPIPPYSTGRIKPNQPCLATAS